MKTLKDFLTKFHTGCENLGINPPDISNPSGDCLLWETLDYPELELSYDLDHYNILTGITLSVLLDKDDDEETQSFHHELLEGNHLLITTMINLVSTLFSDTTNSDACDYQYNISTDHGTMPGESGTWQFKLKITDYLS